MIESPRFEQKDSAEQRFLFGSEDRLMQAAQFASDPVGYLSKYNDQLREGKSDTTDIVLGIMDLIYECQKVIFDNDIPLSNKAAADIFSNELYSPESLMGLFSLLKESGFTKEEVLTWILIEDDEMTHSERLDNRGMRVVLNKVYGEK